MHIAPLSPTVDTLAHNVEETVQQVQHPYADEVEPVGRDQPDHREPDPAKLQINLSLLQGKEMIWPNLRT